MSSLIRTSTTQSKRINSLERVPQAAKERVEIAAAQKGFGDFGEGAIFEGAIVGGHEGTSPF